MNSTQKLLRAYQRKVNRRYRYRLLNYLIKKDKAKAGATRIVIFRNKTVLKIPRLDLSFDSFLQGWIANRNENKKYISATSKYRNNQIDTDPKELLCPVLKSFLLGLIIIMQRADPLTETEFNEKARYLRSFDLWYWVGNEDEIRLNNFGKIDDKIVCVDYGSE